MPPPARITFLASCTNNEYNDKDHQHICNQEHPIRKKVEPLKFKLPSEKQRKICYGDALILDRAYGKPIHVRYISKIYAKHVYVYRQVYTYKSKVGQEIIILKCTGCEKYNKSKFF